MPMPARASSVAVSYLRSSTNCHELSPDSQRAAIDAWAKREGVEIVDTHEDLAVSGDAPLEKRPWAHRRD